ncbi:hypothetical protein [Collinsella tanakaei]|uniref:restriction endonuclease subunit S n=1 Tax=Collinsella tanakaei TaxID=626935 RepID=UPI002942D1B9|nr:hypothetical protein [Collinsella tanakaei]
MAAKPRFDGEWVRLGELISKAKSKRCGSEIYPVLSMTMHDGIVEQADRFKKKIASRDTSSYKVVEPGQLVVGFPIDEGVIYVQNYPYPGIMSPAYNVWDINGDLIDPAYLELVLHGPKSMAYYADKMRGTTARRRSLTADNLCAMRVPLPSLERQRRVVHLFNTVKDEMVIAGRVVEALDQLVKSRFAEMFGDAGWPVATVGSLAVDVRYGTSKKASDCGEYVYLRMNNMTDDGRLDLDDVKRIDLNGPELEKCRVVDGDLLFNRTNSREKVGKTVVFHEREPMVIAGYIIRVRLGDRVRPDFLATYMNLPTTKAMLRSIAKGAVHQANINSRELSAIEVPVPPMELQDRFLSFAAEVDKSRFIVQQQIEKLQMLYDSLAQEYFS